MKGPIRKIVREMPLERRIVLEEYPKLFEQARGEGFFLPPLSKIKELSNRDELLLVMSKGACTITFDDEIVVGEVRRWFLHDNASVPSFGRSFIDNDDLAMKTASLFFHDPGYRAHFEGMGKTEQDKLFTAILKYYKKNWLQRRLVAGAFKTRTAHKAWLSSFPERERARKVTSFTRYPKGSK